MKAIQLTQGKVCVVDDDDYQRLAKFSWSSHKNRKRSSFYAVTNLNGHQVKMHRYILGLEHGDGKQVDHADGDGLNNQKHNLRLVSSSQNHRNSKKRGYYGGKRAHSKYKGVTRRPASEHRARPWLSRIKVGKKTLYLGYYSTPKAAALAYNVAARKHFGDFAKLNKV